MVKKQTISFKLNGADVDVVVEPRELLIHTLRERLQHTGPHIGCETSHCGACTVDLNGMSVKSCTVLTVQCRGCQGAHGRGIRTGRGLARAAGRVYAGTWTAVRFLHARDDYTRLPATQENPNPSEEEIRYWMAGNLCRCTGYQNIVKAVQYAANKMSLARTGT